jgi:hypothetical protein
MSRLFIALVVVAASGCQCFQPVNEQGFEPDAAVPPDAGPAPEDAGAPDAGAPDAGPRDGGKECRLAADCPWTFPGDGGALFLPCPNSEGMSCLDGRCIFECDSGRACTTDAGTHCLTCVAPSPSTTCGPTLCASRQTCHMTVSDSTCAAGPVVGAEYVLSKQNDCGLVVTRPDSGVPVGLVWELTPGQFYGTFPGVEGTCVGHNLYTGAPREQWSCPGGCAFVELGCE